MEGVGPAQLLPQRNVVHTGSSEETQAREKLWLLDSICAVPVSNHLIKPGTVVFVDPPKLIPV